MTLHFKKNITIYLKSFLNEKKTKNKTIPKIKSHVRIV